MSGTGIKIPTPEDLRGEDRVKQFVSDEDKAVISKLDKLPERKKRLIALSLAQAGQKPFIELCRQAGYSIGKGSRASNLKKQINGILGEALLGIGFTEFDIVSKLTQLFNAEKHDLIKIPIHDEKGNIANYKIEVVTTPDHAVQLKALKMLIEIGGYFAPKKLNLSGKVEHEHDIGKKALHEFKERERELAEKQARIVMSTDAEVSDAVVN